MVTQYASGSRSENSIVPVVWIHMWLFFQQADERALVKAISKLSTRKSPLPGQSLNLDAGLDALSCSAPIPGQTRTINVSQKEAPGTHHLYRCGGAGWLEKPRHGWEDIRRRGAKARAT